jgi:hypothetical protein
MTAQETKQTDANEKKAETREKLFLALFGSLLTLVVSLFSVFVGQYLAQQNSERAFRLQRQQELRERSYTKLLALKVPWSQAVQTHVEANMLSDYYYARFQALTHDKEDLAEAKRQNDRALALIPTISDVQRQVFEALAEARIGFAPTPELDKGFDAIYSFQTISLKKFERDKVRTVADLDRWKEQAGKEVVALAKGQYQDPIDAILPQLLAQLRANGR